MLAPLTEFVRAHQPSFPLRARVEAVTLVDSLSEHTLSSADTCPCTRSIVIHTESIAHHSHSLFPAQSYSFQRHSIINHHPAPSLSLFLASTRLYCVNGNPMMSVSPSLTTALLNPGIHLSARTVSLSAASRLSSCRSLTFPHRPCHAYICVEARTSHYTQSMPAMPTKQGSSHSARSLTHLLVRSRTIRARLYCQQHNVLTCSNLLVSLNNSLSPFPCRHVAHGLDKATMLRFSSRDSIRHDCNDPGTCSAQPLSLCPEYAT
jgi:hypothetical protein